MTQYRPVVIGANGTEELPASDTIGGFFGITCGYILVDNGGLQTRGFDDLHTLTIMPTSAQTADRYLNLALGDADRTLTISANVSLNQSLLTTSSPTFAGLTVEVGTGSNPTFILKDGDVASPFQVLSPATTATEAVRWGVGSSTAGGGYLGGFTDADAVGFYLEGHINSSSPTSTAVAIRGYKTNGSTGRSALSGTEQILDIGAGSTSVVVVNANGGLLSKGTGGIGYTTGAGGTVTQATSKSTGVTLNKTCGEITMNNASLMPATTVSFVLTNSTIGAGDVLVINHASTGTFGSYLINARCGSGSATIDVRNIQTSLLSEAIVLRFAVIKGVTS